MISTQFEHNLKRAIRQRGAQVLADCLIIDLPDLGGAAKLRQLEAPVRTLISLAGHA
jgi:adenine phosphoribosyltransferase